MLTLYSLQMIKLTINEEILFANMKQVATENQVILRAAGGWVRDKLIGRQSHDIDIAVEHSSGYDFAVKFMDHLKNQNIETHSIGQIMANPEKSKNLQTATTKALGFELDFVGLRKEIYTEESRIPVITEAEAEEDAFRRDLRCNALFYNICTEQVEDYTGGIGDIQ